jgi:hypothetical protein
VSFAPCDSWEIRFAPGDDEPTGWTMPVIGWAVVAQTMRDGSTYTRVEPVILEQEDWSPERLSEYLESMGLKGSDCKLTRVVAAS